MTRPKLGESKPDPRNKRERGTVTFVGEHYYYCQREDGTRFQVSLTKPEPKKRTYKRRAPAARKPPKPKPWKQKPGGPINPLLVVLASRVRQQKGL